MGFQKYFSQYDRGLHAKIISTMATRITSFLLILSIPPTRTHTHTHKHRHPTKSMVLHIISPNM